MTKINDRFFSSFYNTLQHRKQLIICNNKEVHILLYFMVSTGSKYPKIDIFLENIP